jgi:hypothetical protein
LFRYYILPRLFINDWINFNNISMNYCYLYMFYFVLSLIFPLLLYLKYYPNFIFIY